MPVEDLIRYFNAADHATDSLLYPRGNVVEAWHCGLRLGSLFEPVVALPDEAVVGHRAVLLAVNSEGYPITSASTYTLCKTKHDIVHFDRLCRTLHALNFLAQKSSTGGWLQVAVHPRHLLAVPNQHGLVYEAILKRCGLAPEDIVLELDAHGIDVDGRFAHALANYRQRGYQLALEVTDTAQLPKAIALEPDILRHPVSLTTGAPPQSVRRHALQCHEINDDSAWLAAQRIGIELASGRRFGPPAATCLPTHKTALSPYNSPTANGVLHENRQ